MISWYPFATVGVSKVCLCDDDDDDDDDDDE
jgi:hypothetical protein